MEKKAEKKGYVKPELKSYGTVDALTCGPVGGTLDVLIGSDGGFEDHPTGS